MIVYGNLDYIRENQENIRKLLLFTEIWIIYSETLNNEYIGVIRQMSS